jgi:hypothetical protein
MQMKMERHREQEKNTRPRQKRMQSMRGLRSYYGCHAEKIAVAVIMMVGAA